jgi:hypothetical protein
VGILGLLLFWFPFIGAGIAFLGLLLGAAGLFICLVRRGSGMGFAIAGTAVSVVAIMLGGIWTAVVASAAHGLAEISRRAQEDMPKVEIQHAPPEVNPAGLETMPDAEPEPEAETPAAAPTPKPQAPPKPKAPPKAETPVKADAGVPWGDLAILGDVSVGITRVTTGKVKLKSAFGSGKVSVEPATTIWLRLENRSKAKKINYSSWAGRISFGDGPKLSDNFDNRYKEIDFGISKVEGASGSESIYPGKSVLDAIVFELPIDAAETLVLELAANVFGEKGTLKFQIPKDEIEAE